MHELSIALSLIDLADNHARREGARRVSALHVRLGEISGVQKALYGCFGAAARDSLCEDANLFIEEVPVTLHCRYCNETYRPRGPFNFRCGRCSMPSAEMVTGREMQVTAIELEFGDAPPAPVKSGVEVWESIAGSVAP